MILEEKYNSDEERIIVTESFLNEYLNFNTYVMTQEYIDLIINSTYARSYFKDEQKIIKIKDLPENYDDFILISDKEDRANISSSICKPLIIANQSNNLGCFSEMSRIFTNFLEYSAQVVFHDGKFYKIFRKESNDNIYTEHLGILIDILDVRYFTFSKINSPKLFAHIWKNKEEFNHNYYADEDIYFNYNHSFIQYIIKNCIEIKRSSEYKKIIKSVFSFLVELNQKEIDSSNIKKLNEITQPLNSISKMNKFKLSDF